jgi:hypothetical protein
VIHFGEIVVIRGQPEDGNRLDAGRSCLFCQLDRGQGLVDGEHGAAEQTDLLPSHDGCRALAQAIDVCESLRRGVPGFVLPFNNRADALPPGWIVLNRRCLLLRPITEVRRMRVERLNARRICKEIGE